MMQIQPTTDPRVIVADAGEKEVQNPRQLKVHKKNYIGHEHGKAKNQAERVSSRAGDL